MQKFVAYYLHKWQPGAAPKPVDRDVHRIHAWIAAAYQDRRWFAEPAGGWAPGASGTAAHKGSTTSTEVRACLGEELSEGLQLLLCSAAAMRRCNRHNRPASTAL